MPACQFGGDIRLCAMCVSFSWCTIRPLVFPADTINLLFASWCDTVWHNISNSTRLHSTSEVWRQWECFLGETWAATETWPQSSLHFIPLVSNKLGRLFNHGMPGLPHVFRGATLIQRRCDGGRVCRSPPLQSTIKHVYIKDILSLTNRDSGRKEKEKIL